MAIQMRRGANSDFSPSKMLPGEIAVTTDGTRKVYAAFKANDVKELASKEDVQGLINGFTSVVDREIAEAEQRIESKGQQVLDTIPDLYEEVSVRADEAVRTKADAIVCSVSGVNPIAQDSSNDYLRNLKLYGKTTQGENPSPNNPQPLESKGKWGNLWDEKTYPLVVGYWINLNTGEEHSSDSTSKATLEYIPVSTYVGKTLTINKIATGANSGIAFYDSNKTYISGLRTLTFTVPTNAYYMRFCEDVTETDIMLNEGTTALPYRPYSGQMEINNNILGKNQLPYPYHSGKNFDKYGLTFTENNGVVSITGTNTSNTDINYSLHDANVLTLKPNTEYVLTGISAANVTFIVGGKDSNVPYTFGKYITFTTNSEGKFGHCLIQVKPNATVNTVVKPMIRIASIEDDTYEPYTKQSHISLVGDGLKGIPVTDASLATYTDENGQMWCADYVDCERGVLVQRIGKLNLANLLDWTHFDGWKNPYSYFSADALKTGVYVNGYGTVACLMCNRFIVDAPEKLVNYSDINGRIGQANITVYITLEGVTTETEVKAYFAENETILYYILATPIETPLSASELASYKALKSNYNVTSVMNDCDAFTEVQYNADMETWINNAIDERISKALAQYKEE